MLEYHIIRKESNEEIAIDMLEFPQQLIDFLKEQKIFVTNNNIVLGILSNTLYVDNLRGLWPVTRVTGSSIKIPLVQENKKAEPDHGTGNRPIINYRGAHDGQMITEEFVAAMNNLCEIVFQCKMLIKLSAPYVDNAVERKTTVILQPM